MNDVTHPKSGVAAMVIYMKESALHNCCQLQKINFFLLYVFNVWNKLTLYDILILTEFANLPQWLFCINL